jgi:asparagine N-glycosylation enzyme membrane subunit Stt3
MNIFQHKISSGLVALIAILVCYVSFTSQPSEAYLFPRVISVFFLVLALWTFVKALMGRSRAGNGLSVEMFKNMMPGVIVSAIYIFWAAKSVGFYVSTTVAFFLLVSLYDPSPNSEPKTWIKRVVITVGFIAVMYALFAKILVVYTPRGMFI